MINWLYKICVDIVWAVSFVFEGCLSDNLLSTGTAWGQSPSNSSGLQWLLWQGLITERAAMARRLREPVRVGIGLYRPG